MLMKYFILLLIIVSQSIFVSAQITTPVIKAAFGVDADLRANFFNGFLQSGNDDWYNNGTAGTGRFVIDTTGAAAILAAYATDVSPWPRRMASFYRTMSLPTYTVFNNRLWLDALFVRDYHGNDTTVYAAGSSKNGMSPVNWNCPVAQSIPDKNDILDMFMHLRRAGPTNTDSLWMFGGLSLDNTTGNRYFDFEMYQTDIYYDRVSRKWFGYGPDMGHTSWQLDAAGNILKAGDIIFTGEFQSSVLTNVEARIWIDRATLSTTPAQFSWKDPSGGTFFDGASNGAQFGYAAILPKTAGTYYTGLGSGTNTWAGAFSVVLQNNVIAANYLKDQFMEFSVNLTKLGLDPAIFGGDVCGSPFNRIVVKTRASAAFTAELKDFVAPTDLFLAPRVDVAAEVPIFCSDTAISNISVLNPHATSVYNWTTTNGNIVGANTGPSILVDTPGTYIVTQRLVAGCNIYATDTVSVIRDTTCSVLPGIMKAFFGSYNFTEEKADLQWSVLNNSAISSFVLERSTDGRNFADAGILFASNSSGSASYKYSDDLSEVFEPLVEYRVKLNNKNGSYIYSKVLRINRAMTMRDELIIAPNPVRDKFLLTVNSFLAQDAEVIFMDMQGRPVLRTDQKIKKGINQFAFTVNENWQPGVYYALIKLNKQTYNARFVIMR